MPFGSAKRKKNCGAGADPMAKHGDHSEGTRNIGKSQPKAGKTAPAPRGHNQPKHKHKLRLRHTDFGGRSSCLAYAELDPNDETITVEFQDGATADYPCTLEDWKALKDAGSVGQEFNFFIKV